MDVSGTPLFLLKGGTMLQYRLPGMSRTIQDIDGLVRGDIDRFLTELDGFPHPRWPGSGCPPRTTPDHLITAARSASSSG